MSRATWIRCQRRDLLSRLDLEVLRDLEAALHEADHDGDHEWQIAAVNEEIASRVAANLADSIDRKRTSDKLLDAYKVKVGTMGAGS